MAYTLRQYGQGIMRFDLSKEFDGPSARLIEVGRRYANSLESNLSAQRSLEKTGFVVEGRSRKAEYFAGRY